MRVKDHIEKRMQGLGSRVSVIYCAHLSSPLESDKYRTCMTRIEKRSRRVSAIYDQDKLIYRQQYRVALHGKLRTS